jgi:hypothetical protein
VAEPVQLAIFGVSLNNTSGGTIQEVVGWQLTGGPAGEDEIWRWDPSVPGYARNWLYVIGNPTWDGTWIDQGSGSPSTMPLPIGSGYWARSVQTGTTQTIYTDGLVPSSEVGVLLEVPATGAWNQQMGQPLPATVALDEASTTLWSDGAYGEVSGGNTDEIWLYRQDTNMYWRNWLLDMGGNPTWDGTWIDQQSAAPTTATLDAGYGFWFRPRSDADTGQTRAPGFIWTEPLPY